MTLEVGLWERSGCKLVGVLTAAQEMTWKKKLRSDVLRYFREREILSANDSESTVANGLKIDVDYQKGDRIGM